VRSTRLVAPLACLALAACGSEPTAPAPTSIDVGTHALRVRIMGEGPPTVVVDVGIAGRSDEWYPIQDRLASEACVVVYDRAGYGASEPGPLPRDSGTEMDELEVLLERAAVPKPYVLVGHSLGALNLQVFAARHPEQVAGLVLLDPPPLAWLLGEGFPELRTMADGMTAEWEAAAEAGPSSSDPRQQAESAFFRTIASEHREMFGESARLAAEIGSFGDVPVTVIASGRPNAAFGAAAEEYQRFWIEQSRAVADKSARGHFELAGDSSHDLPVDARDLVVRSILSAVAEATGRGGRE